MSVPIAPTPTQAVPTLYRRLIKMYIRKFEGNDELIVRAWKQTRFEFRYNRRVPSEEVPVLIARGNDILKALRGGLIPVRRNATTGNTYISIDQDTLDANNGHVEPLTAEEVLRRGYKKYSPAELKELQDMLVQGGRWQGKLEFERVANLKKKVKCTDPDEPAA